MNVRDLWDQRRTEGRSRNRNSKDASEEYVLQRCLYVANARQLTSQSNSDVTEVTFVTSRTVVTFVTSSCFLTIIRATTHLAIKLSLKCTR